MTISRRQFLLSSLSGAALLGAGLNAGKAVYSIEPVTREILIPDLPKEFHGYKIGFLTDFHLGPFVKEDWIAEAFDIVGRAETDLLILGGDYQGIPDSPLSKTFPVNNSVDHCGNKGFCQAEYVFGRFLELLSILRPPDGVAAVLGNHDRRNSPDVCARTFAKRTDIRLLENQRFAVRRGAAELEILGIADYLAGIPVLPEARSYATSILVSHNPDFVSALLQGGPERFGLALCGHTHGGQIRLPLVGALTYNINDIRLGEGLVDFYGTPVYTSRGIGMVEIPVRLNCPAEATVITLKTA